MPLRYLIKLLVPSKLLLYKFPRPGSEDTRIYKCKAYKYLFSQTGLMSYKECDLYQFPVNWDIKEKEDDKSWIIQIRQGKNGRFF